MINPTEHIKSNEIKWNRRSKTYDLKIFHYFRWMQKKVVDHLNIKPNSHFLDIGCGTGWAVYYVANKLKDKGYFVGVDISEGMIDKAYQKSDGFKNMQFIKSSADELPFENDYFDYVICTNSFHHHPNPEKSVGEISRVLKNGGQVYILDVTNDNLLANLLEKYFKFTEKEHVKFYNSGEFIKMFLSVGLRPTQNWKLGFIFKIHCAEKT